MRILIFLACITLLLGCSDDSENKEKAEALDALGRQHVMSGDSKGAIPIYSEAIRLSPRDGFIYYNRGAARLHVGDYDGAIADFSEVIRLEPKLKADAYQARGDAKNYKGDTKGAKEDWLRKYTGDSK